MVKLPENITFPAVILFGDSIVDQGNNNNLSTLMKCDFPPYGKDFMGGKPTGRFSNGKTPADFLAEELGIKEYVPAYLDPNLQTKDLPTGVSFASGATGYDPQTPKRLQYDIDAYTDLLVNSASSVIQELYKLGARRIGVFGAPPLGCMPSQRTLSWGLSRQCLEGHNQAAQLFNEKLSPQLDYLNKSLAQSRVVYIDIYSPLLDIIENPQKHVEELGIKELLPAYLDPTLQNQDLTSGVNFASGGAGYDPLNI
ncbi:hypothetical protein F0562_027102 [Nyssa sinensis]|uniref:SGNH hydrolase-type esterase domain-containing protein n=1 Tax=Nyssa sinensis TaxID=561372 RepID=A0A5J5B4P1_9ASTE|nr:hypothetical protein F0562_027102 [Nyssa sinensis]